MFEVASAILQTVFKVEGYQILFPIVNRVVRIEPRVSKNDGVLNL